MTNQERSKICCPECGYDRVEKAVSEIEVTFQGIGLHESNVLGTTSYNEKTIYIKCLKCGLKLFGSLADTSFDNHTEIKKYDDTITPEELVVQLKYICKRMYDSELVEVREALEKGWKPNFDELWQSHIECLIENNDWDGDVVGYYESSFTSNAERIEELKYAIITLKAEDYLDSINEKEGEGKCL